MIITYSKPEFKEAILKGTKIHTIRDDANDRWAVGKSMQHWLYNPRHTWKHPHEFLKNTCTNIDVLYVGKYEMSLSVLDGTEWMELNIGQMNIIAMNDGFYHAGEMFDFLDQMGGTRYKKLLHWTDLSYAKQFML